MAAFIRNMMVNTWILSSFLGKAMAFSSWGTPKTCFPLHENLDDHFGSPTARTFHMGPGSSHVDWTSGFTTLATGILVEIFTYYIHLDELIPTHITWGVP